jgi:hypothetical protein
VRLEAIGLDDHPLLAPEEVGSDHRPAVTEIKPLLDLRVGYADTAGEREHSLLELVPRRRAPRQVFGEHRLQNRGRPARGVVLDLIPEPREVEDLEDRRLVEGALDAAAVQQLGEIEQRSGDGGARNSLREHDVARP